jgi:hypothetical protein
MHAGCARLAIGKQRPYLYSAPQLEMARGNKRFPADRTRRRLNACDRQGPNFLKVPLNMLNSLDLPGRPEDTRVVVAMSGGVDSSVVAAMMNAEGYDVIGVTLQLYDHGAAVAKAKSCCAGVDIHDARRAAEKIGIPHYVLDYESRFKEQVMDRFADSYIAGETPIPCVSCNQTVKFTDLLKTARDLGADAWQPATTFAPQRRATSAPFSARQTLTGIRATSCSPRRRNSWISSASRWAACRRLKSANLPQEFGLVRCQQAGQPGHLLRAQRRLCRGHPQAAAERGRTG